MIPDNQQGYKTLIGGWPLLSPHFVGQELAGVGDRGAVLRQNQTASPTGSLQRSQALTADGTAGYGVTSCAGRRAYR